MSAVALTKQWIYTRASGDAQLVAAAPGGIHDEEAPTGTTGTYVVFKLMSATDFNAIGDIRAKSDVLIQITAIRQQRSTIALATAAGRIDALFHGQKHIAVIGGTIISCRREQEINLGLRQADGTFYTYLGGLYRLEVQEG